MKTFALIYSSLVQTSLVTNELEIVVVIVSQRIANYYVVRESWSKHGLIHRFIVIGRLLAYIKKIANDPTHS
jgi:hypothetical protein